MVVNDRRSLLRYGLNLKGKDTIGLVFHFISRSHLGLLGMKS